MVQLRIPNFLRLYLNPFVAQTCLAINEIVHTVWPRTKTLGPRPSFLANSGEEALSGAIKLARFTLNRRPATHGKTEFGSNVVVIDDRNIYDGFASTTIRNLAGETVRIEFIPGVEEISGAAFSSDGTMDDMFGIVVLASISRDVNRRDLRKRLAEFANRGGIIICCVTADWEMNPLTDDNEQPEDVFVSPDIVVLDQSFTNHAVPFGAFSSTAELYAPWQQRGMATFHSTTYQPNSISTMHFLKCLEENSQGFFNQIRPALQLLLVDQEKLLRAFRDMFSPSLARMITAAGFADEEVTASGHFFRAGSRRIFDGVAGVACSLRGHNPQTWVSEMISSGFGVDPRRELQERLCRLTGLRHFVPAVSGASAAEHALRIALVAQSPRRTIVALRGGYGGKTLLALSGTSKESYKSYLAPLYPDVIYIDPFAADACEQLRRTACEHDVAVIQLELIQGVGGVREVPAPLLDTMAQVRREAGSLIFIDEIQTGMFRTGPFCRSQALGLQPDLLTIGKATSDMMIPFAMTLISDRVQYLVKQTQPSFLSSLTRQNEFTLGYRSLLNALREADRLDVTTHVHEAGQQFTRSLKQHLRGIPVVRDVRVFGLLIGIELDLSKSLLSRFGVNTHQVFLAQMLQNSRFPLLMGFCQYEPNVLKLTPPLTITSDEIESVCSTIAESLKASTVELAKTAIRALWRSRKCSRGPRHVERSHR